MKDITLLMSIVLFLTVCFNELKAK